MKTKNIVITVVTAAVFFTVGHVWKKPEDPVKISPSLAVANLLYEEYGYEVMEFIREDYSIAEIIDCYGKDNIVDYVIDCGWAEEKGSGESTTTSSGSDSGSRIVLQTTTQTPPVTRASTSGTTSSEKQDTTVYITNTGSKYHKSGCQYLKDSKIAISLSDAKARGYDPCSKCY